MTTYGMTEKEAREFLHRQLAKHENTTQFYWDSEEAEEALELMVDAVAKLIAANNAKVQRDAHADWQSSRYV